MIPKPKKVRLPSTEPLEKDIERPVCAYARGRGWYVRKFVSPAHRSVPDRLLISPKGRFIFIEFKRPGEVPTEAQIREHNELRQFGATVYVVDNIEKGRRVIMENG